MKLSIIILNYNTKEKTSTCIDSIFTHYKKFIDSKEIEIVLVDNNSTDASMDGFRKKSWSSEIQLIQNKENYGFSKGCNIGAAHAKGSYLLFLNSDTVVEDAKLLQMQNFLEQHTEIGIIGGKLKNNDGSYQASAGVFYTLPRVFLLLLGFERLGKLRYSPHEGRYVDWVSGAMLMVEKAFFEKVGGFDENLFMYMEDMELCYRVKKAKKEVYFYSDCIVEHVSHGSSNRGFAIIQIYKGLLYFYKKHQNFIEYSVVKSLLVVKAEILIILGSILLRKSVVDTYKKALAVAL